MCKAANLSLRRNTDAKNHSPAIRGVFAAFTYVDIFKSNKKDVLFILFLLQLFEPINGRVFGAKNEKHIFFIP